MAVSLYTSRIVLDVLGVVDYGIYNVVGGVVVLFGFLNSAMAASTQRFLTFELGKGDCLRLKEIFSLGVTIHVIIGITVLILAEIIGVWFLNHKLNIPKDRLVAANWIFQFSVFTAVVTILSVPYNALIIAHERMNIFAYVSIIEVSLKLLIVYMLKLFAYDKLILYGILIFSVSVILRIIYGIYCSRNFKESSYVFFWNRKLFKEMSSFAGWNLFGVFAGIGYNQGVNILLNIFFGPIINAARGIAFQVMGAINQLVTNFQMAVDPPITKMYAKNDRDNMYELIFASSKFSFFLLLLFIVPLMLEAKLILSIWLKEVPDNTVLFVRLVLIDILICSWSGPLQILAQATGKVRKYQMVVSIILLLNLPISYLFLRVGYKAEVTFIVSIFLSTIALFGRLIVLKPLSNFPVAKFMKEVVLKVLLIAITTGFVSFFSQRLTSNSLLQLIIVWLTSAISLLVSVWFFGLSHSEKFVVKSFIDKKIKKNLLLG